MREAELGVRRLMIQGLAQPLTDDPVEVVRWLGAVQSQDYAGAKWALGQRIASSTDERIERAFCDGAILRTHVLRPTWHFVTPADIRWMLKLTAPRVLALMAYYFRQLELDDALFAKTNTLIARALEGGNHLTRAELGEVLSRAGVAAGDALRLGHIVSRAELDAVVCSGARRGKQQTYALLDERAPQTRLLARDEALAELARRYFTSHGPATLKDYVWWSGLSVADARAGLEMVKPQLLEEVIEGQSYWFAETAPAASFSAPTVHLLPNYDEYTVGYADRSAIFDAAYYDKLDTRDNSLLGYSIVLNGQIVGTWKRTLRKAEVVVQANLFASLTSEENVALESAVRHYGEFLGLGAKIGA